MIVGKKAAELLHEVALIEPENLPAYNDEAVWLSIQEANEHFELIQDLVREVQAARTDHEGEFDWEGFPGHKSAALLHHDAILRNKRLLLLYHRQRQLLLERLRWQGRAAVEVVKEQLCTAEQTMVKAYDKLLTQYNREVGLELTLDCLPPRDPQIHVMVVQQRGEVFLKNGTVNLQPNTCHFLHRDDAEQLIMDGVVEELDTDL